MADRHPDTRPAGLARAPGQPACGRQADRRRRLQHPAELLDRLGPQWSGHRPDGIAHTRRGSAALPRGPARGRGPAGAALACRRLVRLEAAADRAGSADAGRIATRASDVHGPRTEEAGSRAPFRCCKHCGPRRTCCTARSSVREHRGWIHRISTAETTPWTHRARRGASPRGLGPRRLAP